MPFKVMVCNLGHHGAIGCYYANVLAEIDKEIQITIMRLQC
jgi:hypothetical protein